MRASTDQVRSTLGLDKMTMLENIRFDLTNGGVLRYNTIGYPTVVGGETFYGSPYFERSAMKFGLGLDVQSISLVCYPTPADMVSGQTFIDAILAGFFDGAKVSISRGFFPDASTISDSNYYLLLWVGRVGDIECDGAKVTMTVYSQIEVLNRQVPANVYKSVCSANLFDAACGLNPASFRQSNYCYGGTWDQISVGEYGLGAGYFAGGTIYFVGGPMAGQKYAIRYDFPYGGYLILNFYSRLPMYPAGNEQVYLEPGCDKTQYTCHDKFNNLIRFRGFPFVPQPSTAV